MEGIDERDFGFLVERETKAVQPLEKRDGRRAGKERVFPVSQATAVWHPESPLPDLFRRRIARIDQDVLVNRLCDLCLRPAKQTSIEENATIRVTLENLKTTLLGDSLECELSVANLDGHRPRGSVPSELLAEEFDEMMVGQKSGQPIHTIWFQ